MTPYHQDDWLTEPGHSAGTGGRMSDLFRFEVPTSQGVFVIIGPDELPPDEIKAVAEKIARLIPLLLNEAEDDQEAEAG